MVEEVTTTEDRVPEDRSFFNPLAILENLEYYLKYYLVN